MQNDFSECSRTDVDPVGQCAGFDQGDAVGLAVGQRDSRQDIPPDMIDVEGARHSVRSEAANDRCRRNRNCFGAPSDDGKSGPPDSDVCSDSDSRCSGDWRSGGGGGRDDSDEGGSYSSST